MSELFTATFKVTSVFRLDGILDCTRNGIIHTQDRALYQLDLASWVPSEATFRRCLSLPPCFC